MLSIKTSDQELLSSLREGDCVAFETIYKRYWDLLYNITFSLVQDKHLSADIIQDVFTWIWLNKKDLEITSLKAYLCAAVKFKTLNYIRNQKNKKTISIFTTGNDLHFFSIEDKLEFKELERIIQQAVKKLPPQCQNIYILRKDEGLSNREIAQNLNLSVKTVENHISIALKRLRAALLSIFI